MKYALLIYSQNTPEEYAAMTAANEHATDRGGAWVDYTQAVKDAGALVAAEQLTHTETATSVRVRGEGRLITDGPYVETKEHRSARRARRARARARLWGTAGVLAAACRARRTAGRSRLSRTGPWRLGEGSGNQRQHGIARGTAAPARARHAVKSVSPGAGNLGRPPRRPCLRGQRHGAAVRPTIYDLQRLNRAGAS